MTKIMYTARATSTGGRSGHGATDDGVLDVTLTTPKEMGGDGAVGTNPEQLFAAAYGACFHGALNLLAARTRIAVHDASVQVSVAFGRDPVDGLFMLTADVRIHLPGVEKNVAEELVRNTERFCPYAKMARNGITSIVALAS